MRELRTGTKEKCCEECRHAKFTFHPVYLGRERAFYCRVKGEIHYSAPGLVCEEFKKLFLFKELRRELRLMVALQEMGKHGNE